MAQIASFGVADQYLVGEPEVTMFKAVYRRHTLFAMESIEQTFDGDADFGKKATCTISRNGDLVGPIWLEITLPDLLAYDISPTPPDGNSVDVTNAGYHKDPHGNYWKTLANGRYSEPIGFYQPSTGKYFSDAQIQVLNDTGSITYYDATLQVYGYNETFKSPTIKAYYYEYDTWPYLIPRSDGAFSDSTHHIRWCNSIGHAILQAVEVEIGGMRIDKHYGEWLDIWSELTEKEEKRAGFWNMVGKYSDADYDAGWRRSQSRSRTLYVPLRFCFNTNPGMYLPLVALMYHQIKYNFEFRDYLECIKASVPVSMLTEKDGGEIMSLSGCRLFADFVFLDSMERIRMAEIPHEYLITQLQFLGDEAVPAPSDPNGTRARKYSLNYNHPVRELVWVYTAKSNYERNAVTGNNWFKYGVPGDNDAEVFDEARLVINGHDRFSPRSAPYFRLVQPYEHHTRCPDKKIHCYSFALLSPEDHQPSGQANFSRFDSAQLQFLLNPSLPAGKMKIFGYSFNVIRIANGFAGLAFSS